VSGKNETCSRRAQGAPEARIALFRSPFRGRDDVYPRRFESLRTGKSGSPPARANEWARGLCDKRAVKCIECPNRGRGDDASPESPGRRAL
jgi:hypothetical protein